MTKQNGCPNYDGTGCDHCFDTKSGEFLEDLNLDKNWNDFRGCRNISSRCNKIFNQWRRRNSDDRKGVDLI